MARRSNRTLIPNLRETAQAIADSARGQADQGGQAGQPGQPVPAVPGVEPVRRFGGRRGLQRAGAQIGGALGDLRTQLTEAGFETSQPRGRRGGFARRFGGFSFTDPSGNRGFVSPFSAAPVSRFGGGGGGGGFGPRREAGRFGGAPFGFGQGGGFGRGGGFGNLPVSAFQNSTFVSATPFGFQISPPTQTGLQAGLQAGLQTVPFSGGAQGVIEALLRQRSQDASPPI